MKKLTFFLILALLTTTITAALANTTTGKTNTASPADLDKTPNYNQPQADWLTTPPGLFLMGKWMFTVDKTTQEPRPANWIGQKIYGPNNNMYLYEPINVIIIDSHATSLKNAAERLKDACSKADFPARIFHSGGYLGYMNNQYFDQVDRWFGLNDCCFADAFATAKDINHGRAMGPYQAGTVYYTVIAFSAETFKDGTHRFSSFINARNKFVSNMNAKSGTFAQKQQEQVNMQNQITADYAVANHLDHFTGDHDGYAYVLRSIK